MESGIYCVAHALREQDWMNGKLLEIQSILDRHGLCAKTPKIGHHVTLIPPFRTTEAAAKLLAWGLDYWDTVRMGSVETSDRNFGAIATGFGFFRGEEEDAFIIRLRVDTYLMRAVERGRKKIPEISSWVHPIENYDFNPHLTVVEGKGIADEVEKLLSSGALPKHYVQGFALRFEVPRVLRKNELMHRWEPVA